MNLSKYYSKLIITPLELEIKHIKKNINKKNNLTKKIDKKYLSILQSLLINYYKKYYNLNNID